MSKGTSRKGILVDYHEVIDVRPHSKYLNLFLRVAAIG